MLAKVTFGTGLMIVAAAHAQSLPEPLVYVSSVAPTIIQELRYATDRNFTGQVVDGYVHGDCILTRKTAIALAEAQAHLSASRSGYRLKVYDCYRPLRAVARFMAWTREPERSEIDRYFHPSLPRRALVGAGYIASRSGHSRGNTVDLTIVTTDAPQLTAPTPTDPTCRSAHADNSLDMGTTFDCFDPKAHTHASGLTSHQRANRQLLVEIMERAGFNNYSREWWHFTYPPGDGGQAFDHPVAPPPIATPP